MVNSIGGRLSVLLDKHVFIACWFALWAGHLVYVVRTENDLSVLRFVALGATGLIGTGITAAIGLVYVYVKTYIGFALMVWIARPVVRAELWMSVPLLLLVIIPFDCHPVTPVGWYYVGSNVISFGLALCLTVSGLLGLRAEERARTLLPIEASQPIDLPTLEKEADVLETEIMHDEVRTFDKKSRLRRIYRTLAAFQRR